MMRRISLMALAMFMASSMAARAQSVIFTITPQFQQVDLSVTPNFSIEIRLDASAFATDTGGDTKINSLGLASAFVFFPLANMTFVNGTNNSTSVLNITPAIPWDNALPFHVPPQEAIPGQISQNCAAFDNHFFHPTFNGIPYGAANSNGADILLSTFNFTATVPNNPLLVDNMIFSVVDCTAAPQLDAGGVNPVDHPLTLDNGQVEIIPGAPATPTPPPAASPTPSPNPTASPDPTATPSVNPTATPSVNPTATPTASPNPSASPTAAPTASPNPTSSPNPTASPNPTSTPTASPNPSPSPSANPTATPTETPTPTPLPNYTAEYFPNPANMGNTSYTDNNTFAGTLSFELDYRNQLNTNIQDRSFGQDVVGPLPPIFTIAETFTLTPQFPEPTSWERMWMIRMMGFNVTGGTLAGTPGALTSRSRWYYALQPSSAPQGAMFPSNVGGFLPLGTLQPFGFVDARPTGPTPPSYKYDLSEDTVPPTMAVEIGKLEHGLTGTSMTAHGPTPVNTTRYRVVGPGQIQLDVRPSRNFVRSDGGPAGSLTGRWLVGPTTSASYMSSPNPTPTP